MITVSQIKAARALIGWTQHDLSQKSGVSISAVAQIERGAGNPRATTLRILQKTFENNDVEFSDDPGVKIRQEPFVITVWRGNEAILKVWQDIEDTFENGRGGELLLSSLDDAVWKKFCAKELPEMLKRRQKLGIRTRALIADTKDNHGLPQNDCRIAPKAVVSSETPYYVYKDKVALIKARVPLRIILIRNALLAQSFRAQFQYHWDVGRLAGR